MGRKCVTAPQKVCALCQILAWAWKPGNGDWLANKLLYRKHLTEIAKAEQNFTDTCNYPVCLYCCEALGGIWIHHSSWIWRRSPGAEHKSISASSSAEYSGVAQTGLSLDLGCDKTPFLNANKCWNTAFPGRLTWKHNQKSSSTHSNLPVTIKHTVTRVFIKTTADERIPSGCWMTELTTLPNMWKPVGSKISCCAGGGIHTNLLLLLKILLN